MVELCPKFSFVEIKIEIIMQTIAVLLTVFNRKDKTLECLKRLYNQLPINGYQVDVYLTEDGCTDGTPEVVASQFPEVYIIHGNGNLYWNRGMHIAWQEAAKKNYNFYLWLNDDLLLNKNSLHHILDCSKEKNNICIISGLVSSLDGTTTTYGGYKDGVKVQRTGIMQKIDIMHGNFVLIPRFVFEKIGMNDPYYNHAYGDHDYSLMAKKLNIDIFTTKNYVGECNIDVKIQKCFRSDIPFITRWQLLHTPLAYAKPNEVFYFEKKHYSLLMAIIRYVMVYIRCCFPQLWIKWK